MGTIAAATAIGLVVAVLVAANLPTNVLYPERCAPSSLLGEFCIHYDPALGRYEAPPAGLPADFSRFATDTAQPDTVRLTAGTIVFVATLLIAWMFVALRARRRPDHRITQPHSATLTRDIRQR